VTADQYLDAIVKHYSDAWSKPIDQLRWDRGPMQDLPSGFRVLVLQHSPEMVAYATLGMSPPGDDERLELHLLTRTSPRVRLELVELLTMVAHYHRTGRRLGLGHTVNFGRPWLEGSQCTRGLVSLPYLDGPALEWHEAPSIRFLWLIPITEAELQFKKQRGLEALEDRFERQQFDYLDPARASVV